MYDLIQSIILLLSFLHPYIKVLRKIDISYNIRTRKLKSVQKSNMIYPEKYGTIFIVHLLDLFITKYPQSIVKLHHIKD